MNELKYKYVHEHNGDRVYLKANIANNVLLYNGEVIAMFPYFNRYFNLNEYKGEKLECTPLRDGTVISLYYYKEKWRMMTRNGYDVNDIKIKGLTFKYMLDSTDIDYSKLDKEINYILGFSHPNLHFCESPYLFFINAYKYPLKIDCDIFPLQKKIYLTFEEILDRSYKSKREFFRNDNDPFLGVTFIYNNETYLIQSKAMKLYKKFHSSISE